MFIKHYIASEVSLQRWRAALPEDIQGCYSVNTCEGGGWRGGSGEWPLRYVLFRQVVVQVSSHSADSHTRRVTGTAVWDRKTEWGKFEDQQNTKTTVIKCSSRVQLNKSLFLLWSQLSLTNINSSHLLSSHLTNVGRSRNRWGTNWETEKTTMTLSRGRLIRSVCHKLTWKYFLPPLHSPVRLQLFQQLVSDDLRDDALWENRF